MSGRLFAGLSQVFEHVVASYDFSFVLKARAAVTVVSVNVALPRSIV